QIAHGYEVTIHRSQKATVDRTYVLADPLMNRNASYVALTRHRQDVQVYTDRQTFTDRKHLDRTLSSTSAGICPPSSMPSPPHATSLPIAPTWWRRPGASTPIWPRWSSA
ncbi:MAG TPA: hypothetical protein VKY89_22805, partial [Thermoanaerobaculia bacterium]|nr:hypothetical protein [Thermoanaerobaculia bacterium]